ncbi:unnamed protein product [Urochloa decumbens]|uniref:Uncharacterized protein n=1 Tax=Urochloa decumbens TaxID=240449 RepID=A0ABC9DWX8_9POAL
MARAALTAAFAAVWAAINAIQFYYYFLNLQAAGVAGAGTTAASAAAATTTTSAAQASASSGSGYEFQIFLTLAAVGVLNAAVLLIHRHLRQAEAAGAAGNRRVPDAVAFLLLAAAGLLVHGVPGAVDDDVVAALGAAAFSALPGAATGTFFLGTMTLIFAARVHGGGGAVAGAGFFGEIQGPFLRVLYKVAAGAAAALVFLVTVAAFCIKY